MSCPSLSFRHGCHFDGATDVFHSGFPGKLRLLFCDPLFTVLHSVQEREKTVLHDVAQSLVQLQHLMGCIPNVHIVGRVSKEVATLVKCLLKEGPSPTSRKEVAITDLLLIDRDVDVVSLLASQLTYEGILDETFGIECGEWICWTNTGT